MSVLNRLFKSKQKPSPGITRNEASNALDALLETYPQVIKTLDVPAMQAALEKTGWKSSRPLFVPAGSLHPVQSALEAQISQLKFLLASAPMIDVPMNPVDARDFVKRTQSGFAYVHPKTLARVTFEPLSRSFIVFPGSATKWVLTSMMPENRVIFSPLPIPGLEKILAQ